MLKSGLYEQVINDEMEQELEQIPEQRKALNEVDPAEASKILSSYIAEELQKKLDQIYDASGDRSLEEQIEIANKVVHAFAPEDAADISVSETGHQLFALMDHDDPRLITGKTAKNIKRPETSLAFSSLFTGAVREPQMLSELKNEIESAESIDMLVSFIRWSGLRQMIEELRAFTDHGGKLRVICTSYMGATEPKAIEELSCLKNTEIKISYDTKRTRLHAKSYVFHRDTGFSTAYIGSSNMSNAALTSGLEWNVKATEKDMADTIRKVEATFETYWNDREFETYDASQKQRLIQALRNEKYVGTGTERKFVFDIRPYAYQQEILDKLQAERLVHGYYKNLVCAATGCGKTVISAFDYLNFRKQNPGSNARILFIAHREEILTQSIETYRGVLKDLNFGELYVGSHQPETLDHLFISVQTMNSQKLYEKLPADYYDYIVVDEFHHAAAQTYKKFLSYFTPKILLGLTATPERMDGEDILSYFDGRIAAEIRLPEAIDRKLLCPFQYFGVSDSVDLSEVTWKRGGYDASELTNLYVYERSIAEKRADYIIANTEKYTASIDGMKALGFCVSKAHAHFMADMFNRRGIPSIALDSESKDDVRNSAKKELEAGNIKAIFVVDLYNEGVDIPSVNTVLFLRPTESLTVFLQQLGRGLRLAEGKDCLTVLDFIGQANRRYNFEDKFAALLSNTKHSLKYEIDHDFVSVPKGCYIRLEKKASRYILENIKNSINNKSEMIRRIANFTEDTGRELTFSGFLNYYHLDPRDIYKKGSFARLQVLAGTAEDFEEPMESIVTKALPRLASINARRLLGFGIRFFENMESMPVSSLNTNEMRMLQMLYVSVWMEPITDQTAAEENLKNLAASPVMRSEIIQLLEYSHDKIDFVDSQNSELNAPLDLHCTYTRDQLLVALDFMKPGTVREGVKWLPDRKLDVFFVTLNKSDKDYSPTTMYNDYAVNEELFHMQSQSTTSETSVTGQRYIHHNARGSKVLLCVRDTKKDRWGNAASYTVLGLVDYVKHTGSRPMNITWKLRHKIPAKYIRQVQKLIVG